MSDPAIILTIDQSVVELRLNRPDKRNAIDLAVLDALDGAMDRIEASAHVRVVLVTSAGPSFSAGGDIKAWSAMDAQSFAHDWIRRGHRTFDRLAQLRFPTIAVLDGDAFGGGLELAAACDFRIAEAHVSLGLPEAGLGMVPGWSGTQRLARRFGAQAVRRMALGGEIFDAAEALRMGIVDLVVDTGSGMEAAHDYAARILARGHVAGQTVKLMLAVAAGEAAESALDAIAGAMIGQTQELQEGVAAFIEKRKPDFGDD
jgi:enoyl-CoA hydratase/carnithine racemase